MTLADSMGVSASACCGTPSGPANASDMPVICIVYLVLSMAPATRAVWPRRAHPETARGPQSPGSCFAAGQRAGRAVGDCRRPSVADLWAAVRQRCVGARGRCVRAGDDSAPPAPPSVGLAPGPCWQCWKSRACRPATNARPPAKHRHVEADAPGDLLSLDTFYVGKLKGVGKVWQVTGCDVASSYAWAQLVAGDVTATTPGGSSIP